MKTAHFILIVISSILISSCTTNKQKTKLVIQQLQKKPI